MNISLDTETPGLDFARGKVKPFMATAHSQDWEAPRCWEWPVDPLTRQPDIPESHIDEIAELMDEAELIYMHNSKFDSRALSAIGLCLPWEKVRDTLVAGHILASNHPHNLTDMCIEYLGEDIEEYEVAVKGVVTTCRAIVKKERQFRNWKLAKEGDPDMPSVKTSSKRDEDKPWKNDMWLPKALIKAGWTGYAPDHWKTATMVYACADAIATVNLGPCVEALIRERGYWPHYEHQLQVMRAACEMECTGTTVIGGYTEATIDAYERSGAEAAAEMKCIADEYEHDLELARGAALNDNMRQFFYGSKVWCCRSCDYKKAVKHWNGEPVGQGGACPKCAKGNRYKVAKYSELQLQVQGNLDLPVIESEKTGNATLDKVAMQEYMGTLEGNALEFMRLLTEKRKHDTDLMYMRAYQRFWVPIPGVSGYYKIHPFLNPFNTDHMRWTSFGPNLQNVGGQEDKCEECEGRGCEHCGGSGKTRVSVKNCFGPAPGREWYSMDYRSIEARLPAYESGEPKMLEVFERPDEPPYWGNLYLLNASVLYADEYWPLAQDEGRFRKEHPRLYKRSKFFILAKNYGAGRHKGDLLSGIEDSYDLVDREFPLLSALQERILRDAKRTGWVHTIPDRTVDPTKGYPLLASRSDDGGVLSTTPFNYHTSGTAGWCLNTAVLRCGQRCAEWREGGFDARMPLQVHDEILFDFPRGPREDSNEWRARELQTLMEQSGKNLVPSIPTPVKVEYHARTWAEGRAI